MAAPATADDLLGLLAKSRLLESVDVDGYLSQRRRSASAPERPDELAAALVDDGLLTRFQADNLLQGKWMRYFIGPYKVLEALGAGSSGVVYLCEHERLHRRVAVKVLQGAKARDPKSLERFNREARAAASLNHPNIVRAFDVGQEDRFHYLVMEYVDGQSLRQIVKTDGPLSATLAADYLRQAALGLWHAHEAGLVHRDIKPTNLMVDRDGTLKILDLGLARFYEDDGDELTQGAVLGNVDFMAPEQAIDSHAVDIRADIYSLGATFHYCLTGVRPPRPGFDLVRRQQAAGVDRSDVPQAMWQVVKKMTASRPGDRYQTASEVVEAIAPWAPDEVARVLLGETTETPPPAPTVEVFALQAEAATVADLPAAESTPPPAPPVAPSKTLKEKTKRGHWASPLRVDGRKAWIVAAVLAGLALAGVVAVTRSPSRVALPGRGPGARSYFQPVTPHSP
jgi:serine/threonine protein kinase